MTNELSLNWAFGFSKDKINGVSSLCLQERNALFLISSHSGVVYDFEHRSQTILQGHCNIISCCVVDKNKRWIVTADAGMDSLLVVWDATSFVPVKTFTLPNEGGIEALDISDDALYITTLSYKDANVLSEQELAVWAWTADGNDAILRRTLDIDDYHHSIRFNITDCGHIVSTGSRSVLYWTWDNFSLDYYAGRVSKTDLGHYGGDFVSTVFLPSTENAVTATSEGYVIVWETTSSFKREAGEVQANLKEATKVLKLMDCGINLLTTTANDYLVMACADGAVRFYDYFLRLESWFEDLNAGPITSISFSVQDCPYAYGEGGAPGLKFWVPDFIVGTADGFVVGVESSVFDEVRRDDRRGTLLMQGMSDSVSAVACHPSQPLLAIACSNGVLQVWNYEMKLLMILREFNTASAAMRSDGNTDDAKKTNTLKSRHQLRPSCIAFDTSGKILAAGFSSGVVKLLFTDNLEDISTYAPSSEAIESLCFSASGKYLAGFDSSRHVLLFSAEPPARKTPDQPERGHGTPAAEIGYVYVGRALAHSAPITGLTFGLKDGVETLISISEDQYCVEYNLQASSVSTGVRCVRHDATGTTSHRLELASKPTAIAWYPHLAEEEVEDKFVIANDAFKFKEFSMQSMQCRKTSLAPRFGSPVNRLISIPATAATAAAMEVNNSSSSSNDSADQPATSGGTYLSRLSQFFAFATPYRVIGLSSYPLTGDPSKTMGIVAHPSEVTSLAVSYDGKYLFSAGGVDLSANMWKVTIAPPEDVTAPDADDPEAVAEARGVEGGGAEVAKSVSLAPYFTLLEGGEGGDLHRDIVDYFYYCQLRHLGEDSMEPRNLSGNIPLEEIPSLFRSVGYYPSEDEVNNIINEVRFKNFMVTGETEDYIGLEELIKLYVNHRPALPLDKQLISAAFLTLCRRLSDDPQRIDWDNLLYCFTAEGEKISVADLDAFLFALTGNSSKAIANSDIYTAKSFAEKLLGFEDF